MTTRKKYSKEFKLDAIYLSKLEGPADVEKSDVTGSLSIKFNGDA